MTVRAGARHAVGCGGGRLPVFGRLRGAGLCRACLPHGHHQGRERIQLRAEKKEATREQAAAVLLRTYDRLHAAIKVTEAADGSAPSGCVTAGSITEESGSVPVSPRAPMEEVYAAAVRAGEGRQRGAARRAAAAGDPCGSGNGHAS